jgi:SAM-dependent methyltransferase
VFHPGSFRDRESRVFERDGEILRALSAPAADAWRALAGTRLFARAVADGRIVGTAPSPARPPEAGGAWAAVLRHDRVPCVTFPYEWCFSMLRDAALLQLDLHLEALDEGLQLKDASPYNVQFRGCAPTFIDVGSFEPARPGEPWIGYRQFCQLYLYPLMLQAYRGVDFRPWLRGSLAGIPPAEMRRLLSLRDLLRPGVLAHVVLHARAAAAAAGTADVRRELRDAGFSAALVRANLRGLRRLVSRLAWEPGRSEWSEYEERAPYTAEEREEKAAFVRAALADRPRRVAWDVGCNTGEYSRLAAERAPLVLALDADAVAVERLYRALRAAGERRVVPLAVDLADAAGGLGWRGRERGPLEARCRPDVVLALAVLHHLVLSANVPLDELVGWLADLGGDLVVELVHPEDPMVRRLLARRPDRFPDYRRDRFEALLAARLDVAARRTLRGGTRTLYHARSRE